jgi:hypothetical protein
MTPEEIKEIAELVATERDHFRTHQGSLATKALIAASERLLAHVEEQDTRHKDVTESQFSVIDQLRGRIAELESEEARGEIEIACPHPRCDRGRMLARHGGFFHNAPVDGDSIGTCPICYGTGRIKAKRTKP